MPTALITGCSSGFGYHSALRFLRAGYDVHAGLLDLADDGGLANAAREFSATLTLVQLDVTSDAQVTAAASLLALAPPDILVNNAGIAVHGAIEDTGHDDIERCFAINVFGALRVVRAFAPAMRIRGSGRIVNVTSGAGFAVQPYYGIYSASKFALEAASEALALEMQRFGVEVRIVQPGRFATTIEATQAEATDERSAHHAGMAEFQAAADRLVGGGATWTGGDPADVAEAIFSAATDAAAPFRTLVGADVELAAALRLGKTFEEYRLVLKEGFGWS
jgi:NAD(P)-dependent dehydrogenase (short-subunit alcohol dehydrogenase family)